MKTNKIFLFAALLGTVLVGCQKENEIQKPEEKPSSDQNQAWTLSIQVSKTAETKALTLDTSGSNDKISASWKHGEKVAVYFGADLLGALEVTSADDVDPATLEGQITKPDGLVASSDLFLLFPGRDDNKWTYLGQDGTAPSPSGTMSTLFDYATATLKVETVDEEHHVININSSSSSTSFANKQSVYRFGFKVNGAGDNIELKSLLLSASDGKLVRSYTNTSGDWEAEKGPIMLVPSDGVTDNIYYMSICNESVATENYVFSVVGTDNVLYEGVKEIPSTAHGVGKLISARNISVAKKTMGPEDTGEIGLEANVL